MQYVERRCQEARYLLNAIKNEAEKKSALHLIETKEKEWEDAYGKKKWW
jgi:hypothetical protein